MNKSLRIYVILLLLLLVVIIALDINKPKPINWEPTYAINDKIPLGLHILDQELANLTKQKITKIATSAYEFLEPYYDYDSLVNNYKFKGTILYISDNKIIDTQSVQEILYFVNHKNTAFFSMKEMPKMILDTLKLEVGYDLKLTDSIQHLWLANSVFKNKKFDYKEEVAPDYFSKFDTINTTVLGCQSGDSTRVNFIKVRYKSGVIFLHTQPAVFTNFHLLKDNHHEYAENILSYLPKSDIYWLTNQKLAGIPKNRCWI